MGKGLRTANERLAEAKQEGVLSHSVSGVIGAMEEYIRRGYSEEMVLRGVAKQILAGSIEEIMTYANEVQDTIFESKRLVSTRSDVIVIERIAEKMFKLYELLKEI